MTNAIEKELKKDHKKIKSLMQDLETAIEEGNSDRKEIYTVLKQELLAHSKAEEQAYYSKLYSDEKTKDIAKEGKQEHHVVELLFNEMDKLNINNDDWKAKFEVLKENVEHHIKEEENELFTQAEKVIRTETANEEVRDEFLRDKKKAMAA